MTHFCPSLQKTIFIFANSAEPYEMQHNAAFHLDLHLITKVLPYQNEKDLIKAAQLSSGDRGLYFDLTGFIQASSCKIQ